jgi:hypothetical protein
VSAAASSAPPRQDRATAAPPPTSLPSRLTGSLDSSDARFADCGASIEEAMPCFGRATTRARCSRRDVVLQVHAGARSSPLPLLTAISRVRSHRRGVSWIAAVSANSVDTPAAPRADTEQSVSTRPLDDVVGELQHRHTSALSAVQPWFVKNMSPSYFHTVSPTSQTRHLESVRALPA